MIRNFSEHSANERTFLAWVRTGIAVIAFGFVLEKFNLFIAAVGSTSPEIAKIIRLDRLSGPLGRYDGFALMVTGIVLIVIGYLRFAYDERMIDNPEDVRSLGVRTELAVTVILVVLTGAYCISVLSR